MLFIFYLCNDIASVPDIQILVDSKRRNVYGLLIKETDDTVIKMANKYEVCWSNYYD